jgi:hypothetical protein
MVTRRPPTYRGMDKGLIINGFERGSTGRVGARQRKGMGEKINANQCETRAR